MTLVLGYVPAAMHRHAATDIVLATSLAWITGFGCGATPAEHPPAAPAPAPPVVAQSSPVAASPVAASPVAASSASPAPEPALLRSAPAAGRERVSFAV